MSCSDSEPKVERVDGYLVFDFADETANADVKLSVFTETSSDARRVDKIELNSKTSEYRWISSEPTVISNDKKQWAGSSDFRCPKNVKFPEGIYEVNFVDSKERISSVNFNVSYPDELYSCDSSKVEELMKLNFIKQLAVYSEDGTLVYYGIKKDSWRDETSIFSHNKTGAYFRYVYISLMHPVICVMPPVNKNKDKENK